MPQVNPAHRTDALLIGTGEFSFSPNSATVAAAASAGYIDFGNVKVFDIKSQADMKEHYGSYRGTMRRDRIDGRKIRLGYDLTVDEFNANLLNYMFQGKAATPSNYTRAVLTAAAGTALNFVTVNSDPTRWYDILDATGNKVPFLTTVTIAAKVEGTDFQLDLTLGRVQFLTLQTTSLSPLITAVAVVAGDNNNLSIITPLTQGTIFGVGRITCYDELSRQSIVWEHRDFYGQIMLSGSPTVKGDDYSDFKLSVNVGTPAGSIFVRSGYPN